MTLVGYLLLSPDRLAAGSAAPHNVLIAAGVQKLFIDIVPGETGAERPGQPQLELAMAELGPTDTLVTPGVDTLTRSIVGLLEIHQRVQSVGASLRVLALAGGLHLDTSTIEGRAILGALSVMSLMRPADQAEPGPAEPPVVIATPARPGAIQANAARAAAVSSSGFAQPGPIAAPPDYAAILAQLPTARPRGRPATVGTHSTEINRLRAQGVRAVDIATCLGIGRASVYRILNQGQIDQPVDPAMADG